MQLIRVVSFTQKGERLAEKIAYEGECFKVDHKLPGEDTREFLKESFAMAVPVVFIGACGIAVRLIAPLVRDKFIDSAVVVIDEKGKYVIPILSGHIGGANKLAKELAGITRGEAVLTTSTDVNELFAADLFAKYNGLRIYNRDGIKAVSSKIIDKGLIEMSLSPDIGFNSYEVPEGIAIKAYPPEKPVDIIVSFDEGDRDMCSLLLIPKEYTVGIGCRKGISAETIEKQLDKCLNLAGLNTYCGEVAVIASIDLKVAEYGLLKCAAKKGLRLKTYPEERLREIEGDFTKSEFVKDITGVDNVCERAAVCAAGKSGELILKKQAENGVTVAIAKRIVRIKRWKE
ncbi:MAG: cobalamin biosynthesis protein [Lachnospiraceae bacterium]|nr:cobalamin biosynthesis protein [Lachnospiraceae bacterium]